MTFLAALAKNNSKPQTMLSLVERHILTLPVEEHRKDFMFHPSDLAGEFCPRAWVLFNYHPEGLTVRASSFTTRHQRIFDNGKHVHTRIQRYLADNLWGTWERLRGWDGDKPLFDFHQGFKPAGKGWVYGELELRDDSLRMLGSTDGLVKLVGKRGLEAKSINSEGFKWLKDEPKKVHKHQVLIYMHMLEAMRKAKAAAKKFIDSFDMLPVTSFHIYYESKDTQEIKEYEVPYNETEVKDFMATRLPLMEEALEYEKSGRFPACHCAPGKKSALCKVFDHIPASASAAA